MAFPPTEQTFLNVLYICIKYHEGCVCVCVCVGGGGGGGGWRYHKLSSDKCHHLHQHEK